MNTIIDRFNNIFKGDNLSFVKEDNHIAVYKDSDKLSLMLYSELDNTISTEINEFKRPLNKVGKILNDFFPAFSDSSNIISIINIIQNNSLMKSILDLKSLIKEDSIIYNLGHPDFLIRFHIKDFLRYRNSFNMYCFEEYYFIDTNEIRQVRNISIAFDKSAYAVFNFDWKNNTFQYCLDDIRVNGIDHIYFKEDISKFETIFNKFITDNYINIINHIKNKVGFNIYGNNIEDILKEIEVMEMLNV